MIACILIQIVGECANSYFCLTIIFKSEHGWEIIRRRASTSVNRSFRRILLIRTHSPNHQKRFSTWKSATITQPLTSAGETQSQSRSTSLFMCPSTNINHYLNSNEVWLNMVEYRYLNNNKLNTDSMEGKLQTNEHWK